VAAGTIARPAPALAGSDGDVVLGADNPETSTTSVTINASLTPVADTALQGNNFSSGNGVVGVGRHATGVYGQSGATNGFARTLDGVRGYTDGAGLPTGSGVAGEHASGGHGVSGVTSGAHAAVYGSNLDVGPGLHGFGGVGVLAEASPIGIALQVEGRARFSEAGEAEIRFPARSATVPVPGGLSGKSLVLALLQTATPGVFVTSAVPHFSTGKVTINLNRAPGTRSHPARAKVAWFVVN
jgi:hypothetical protein